MTSEDVSTHVPATDSRRWKIRTSLPSAVLPLAILIASSALGYVLFFKFGLRMAMFALGGVVLAGILVRASMRDLSFAVIGWFLTMGTFRGVGMVTMPGLPDFSFDRLMLVWIVLALLFRRIAGGHLNNRFGVVDLFVLVQAAYVYVQMQLIGDVYRFHEWVLSSLSPLFAFIYGKYVVEDERFVRNILLFFLALTVYFYVTAIAEHFHWRALVWPKVILNPDIGFWAEGRSRGPLLHPPLFGQVLGILCLVHFYFIQRVQTMAWRAVLFVSLVLALLGNFFAYTRGPWLATAVGILVLAALRRGYRRILFTMLGFASVGIVLGLTQIANTAFFQERMAAQNTVENRLGFLANAYRMIGDHPLFGIGYFRYMEYVGLYNQTTYIPFYGMVKRDLSAEVPIHDIFLGRAAEEGLVGIGLIFAFYFLVFRAWRRLWAVDPQGSWMNRDALAVFAAMMICYLVGGMIIDYRYFDFVNVIFYFLAGIICGFDSRWAGSAVAVRLERLPARVRR